MEVTECGLGPKRVEFAAGQQRIFAHCLINILKCLDRMILAAELLVDEIEALSAPSGPLLLSGHEPFDGEIVPFPFLVNFGAL